jgi:hypothetical protein
MDSCPVCKTSLDAGGIFEALRPQEWCAHMDDDELRKYVEEFYGSADARFSRVIGVEHQRLYDGVWEWRCPDCSATWPRFAKRKR